MTDDPEDRPKYIGSRGIYPGTWSGNGIDIVEPAELSSKDAAWLTDLTGSSTSDETRRLPPIPAPITIRAATHSRRET